MKKRASLLVLVALLFNIFSYGVAVSAETYIPKSSPQSCVKVQPHQKHNVLRCEPNCHAFLSEERGQEQ